MIGRKRDKERENERKRYGGSKGVAIGDIFSLVAKGTRCLEALGRAAEERRHKSSVHPRNAGSDHGHGPLQLPHGLLHHPRPVSAITAPPASEPSSISLFFFFFHLMLLYVYSPTKPCLQTFRKSFKSELSELWSRARRIKDDVPRHYLTSLVLIEVYSLFKWTVFC